MDIEEDLNHNINTNKIIRKNKNVLYNEKKQSIYKILNNKNLYILSIKIIHFI